MRVLDRIKAALERDKALPVSALARKGARFAWSMATARAYFAACTRVGRSPRTRGKPYIENLGEIVIGDDFNLSSQFVTSHLVTGPHGKITIGNQVNINYGAGICAYQEIRIGDRVRIGPYAMILDTDFHTAGALDEAAAALPVIIGDDVWLANRVTVLRGATIGAGSVITAGSVVSGEIPAGVIAGGNPARVIRRIEEGEVTAAPVPHVPLRPIGELDLALLEGVRRVFAEAFHLPSPPPLTAGLREVPGWDSLGHLQLLTALEAHFHVTFGAEIGGSLSTVGACAQWVDVLRRPPPVAAPPVIDWPLTLPAALVASAQAHAAAEAIVCDDQVVTYEALLSQIATLAGLLRDQGVKPGEPVILAVDGKAEFIAAYYAVVSLGAVAVPLHDATVLATLQDTARRCEAKHLLCDRAARDRFGGERLAPLSVILVEDAPRTSLPLAESVRRLRAAAVVPADTAAIMFTSGTTVRKAVVITHQNQMQAALNIAVYMGITDSIREYVTVPLTHSFGWGRVRVVLSAGGTVVLQNGPMRAGRVVHAVEFQRVTALSAVPAGVALLRAGGESVMQRLGEHLRLVELGSAVMSVDQKRQLAAAWARTRICMHYGLTEASRSTFLDFKADAEHLDTVGRASPNCQVAICDPNGKPLGVGEQGEIVVRGAHLVKGYLGDPERTAKTFLPDGSMRTGDQGALDAGGYLHFAGRLDEQINHGGMKVSPSEVEEALRPFLPGVDYCVVGLPDPNGIVGELVTLVCGPGAAAPTLEHVSTSMADRLEAYKVPRQVKVVDQLPRTANGKLQRSVLRDSLSPSK